MAFSPYTLLGKLKEQGGGVVHLVDQELHLRKTPNL